MRKLATVILALAMLVFCPALSHAATKAAEYQPLGFTDIKASDWYADAVNYMEEHHIMSGYDGTNIFGVNDSMTRAQFAVVLWRYFNPEAAASYDQAAAVNRTGLPDVENGRYYTEAANWAVKSGAITGVVQKNGTFFCPNQPMTCEQMAVIMQRLFATSAQLSYLPESYNSFADAKNVSSWAATAMKWAYNFDIIKGSGRYLYPRQNVTRARAATVLYRVLTSDMPKENQVYVTPYYTISLPPALANKAGISGSGYSNTWTDLSSGSGMSMGMGYSAGFYNKDTHWSLFEVTIYSDYFGPQGDFNYVDLGACKQLSGTHVFVVGPYWDKNNKPIPESVVESYAKFVTVKNGYNGTNANAVNAAYEKATFTGTVVRKDLSYEETEAAWTTTAYFLELSSPLKVITRDNFGFLNTVTLNRIIINHAAKLDDSDNGAMPELDQYVGEQVTVTGSVSNDQNATHMSNYAFFGKGYKLEPVSEGSEDTSEDPE